MKWMLLLSTPLLLGACNTLHFPVFGNDGSVVKKDSTEIHYIYGDSVDYVMEHASNIKMYQMMGLVRDSDDIRETDSLFNYPIDRSLGKLNKMERELLHFVIDDKHQYRTDYAPIRQPFNPNFALEFSLHKQSVFYFVSLGTGEIAIVDHNANFKFYLMNDSKMIKRWYDYILLRKNKSKRAQ